MTVEAGENGAGTHNHICNKFSSAHTHTHLICLLVATVAAIPLLMPLTMLFDKSDSFMLHNTIWCKFSTAATYIVL